MTLGLVLAAAVIIPKTIFAASQGYSFTVPVWSDSEDGTLTKNNGGESATNKVSSKGSGTLVSRIEYDGGITSGLNATWSVQYTSTGTYYMNYKDGAENYVNDTFRLNVSTGIDQYSTVSTTGQWSPDNI